MTTYAWGLSLTSKEANLLKELCIYLFAIYDHKIKPDDNKIIFNNQISNLCDLYNKLDFQEEQTFYVFETCTLDEIQKMCIIPTKNQRTPVNNITSPQKNAGIFSILSSYDDIVIYSLHMKIKNKKMFCASTSSPCQQAVQNMLNLHKENNEENKILKEEELPLFLQNKKGK